MAVLMIAAFCFGIKAGKEPKVPTKPMESFLIQVVNEPNWITNYGNDLESRLVYNVALLNQVVGRQGKVISGLIPQMKELGQKLDKFNDPNR